MKLKGISIAILFFTSTLFAQKGDTPMNTYDMGGKIDFMKLTESGVLVVAGGGGFAGIKPGESQPHFVFKDYGKVKEEELTFIPMSPYVMIDEGAFGKSRKTVIDVVSGKKLFATEEQGWSIIKSADIFLPQNKLVITGAHDRKSALGVYDLLDGSEVKLMHFKANSPQFITKPVIIDGGLLIGSNQSLMRIDLETGNIVWENKELSKISWLTSDPSGKEIYAFENKGDGTRIHKISSTGNLLWQKERKIKGSIHQFQILPNGLACVSNTVSKSGKVESKISFLSPSDGTDLWEKAPTIKDYVTHFYIQDDGILFGLSGGGINKIDFNGTPLFKKPMKTGDNIHVMANTPKGLIYITDSDCNIVDLKTGESIWAKELKFKRAKLVTDTYDPDRHRYLISTGTELISIDENTGDINHLAEYKFKGSEYPNSIEIRKEGILLSSDQNMLLLNFDGTQKYTLFYQAPGKTAAGAILAGTMAVASTAVAVGSSVSAELHRDVNNIGGGHYALGDYTMTGKMQKEMASSYAKMAGNSFAEMTKRFSATAATENAQFILTKLDDGIGLVKINKDTGQIEKEVILKDRKPMYEVDDLAGLLYYVANTNAIYIYELKQ
ncbi:MAG: PQQ-binding-like beta-propeller repeat protein [Bacteroidales bacterium]|jgi:outer membrane protein assembly factor BamB|nr:PQQ-binding-like beta-propeller repeat protein [Bacteroidales bacterium]